MLHRPSARLAIVCGLFAAGCSTYKDPAVIVTDAKLSELTDEALAVQFGLDMHNPNDEPLTLIEFTYELWVDGKSVFNGVRAAETVLSIKGDKHVEIPGVVCFDKTGWQPGSLPPAFSYRLNGRLQYITPGKIVQILFDSGVRKPTASFKGSGEIMVSPPTTSAAAR